MSFWSRLKLARDARKNIAISIPHTHVKDPRYHPVTLKAGQHYFRLVLSEMSLRRDRAWFASWYPAVHSLVKCIFGDRKVEIPYIAGGLTLPDITPNNLDRVVQMNHPLTGLMPFNGGDVELSAGLFALKGEDYLDDLLKILGDFAQKLTLPQISAALDIAGPLAHGVEELLGARDKTLHLGLHQLFTSGGGGSSNLEAGYFAIILAEERDIDKKHLWIVDGRLRLGTNLDESQPLSGYAYMLFRIECHEERDDWQELNSIREPFSMAVDALMNQQPEVSSWLLRRAYTAVLNAADLTIGHRIAAAYQLKERYKKISNLGLAAIQPDLTNLQLIMDEAMPVETALKLGLPSLEELLS
jgi:hypothetical protein